MSSSDADPAELEGQAQKEADKLQQRSSELKQEVEDVSQDWQRKRADEGIPGAKAPDGDESEGEDTGEEEQSGAPEEEMDGSREDGSDESGDKDEDDREEDSGGEGDDESDEKKSDEDDSDEKKSDEDDSDEKKSDEGDSDKKKPDEDDSDDEEVRRRRVGRRGLAEDLQLGEHAPHLALRRLARDRGLRALRHRVLTLGDPLPARRAADHADPGSGLIVQAATVVDLELALPAQGPRHELLDSVGVELLELLVVERGRDRRERPVDLYVGCHVRAATRRRARRSPRLFAGEQTECFPSARRGTVPPPCPPLDV